MSETTPLSPETLPPEARWLTDRYEFLSELGRGGMAVEYLARERESGRPVSIKLVSSRYPGDGDAIRRFAREARAVAGLHHPNIVRTIAIEEREDAVAVVSAYVHGETLRSALGAAGGPLPFDEAASVLRDVAAALAHAHAQGMVHRDVRPENVFLLDGSRRALLSDFGVARSVDALLTSAGASIATPEYMAPEQADGRPVDARTDVYALGLLGWEMLAGQRPWQGETLHSVLQKQKHEPLPSLATLRPDMPAYLLAAIDGALAKEPSARWRDGADFLTRLTPTPSPVVIHEPAVAEPGAGGSARKPRARKPAARGAAPRVAPEMVAPAEDSLIGPVPTGALPASVRADRAARKRAADDAGARERSVAVPVVAEPVVAAAPVAVAGAPVAASAPPATAVPAATLAAAPAPAPRRRWPLVVGISGAALVMLAALMSGRGEDRAATSGNPALDSMRVAASGAPASGAPARGAPARGATVRSEAGGEVRLPATRPGGGAARTRPAPVTEADVVARDARCASPDGDDQRACLLAQIEREDVALNTTYGALIAALRKGEGNEAVQTLRAEQRAWLLERDEACRARTASGGGAGARWGAARVPCFAEMSGKREEELSARLARATGAR